MTLNLIIVGGVVAYALGCLGTVAYFMGANAHGDLYGEGE